MLGKGFSFAILFGLLCVATVNILLWTRVDNQEYSHVSESDNAMTQVKSLVQPPTTVKSSVFHSIAVFLRTHQYASTTLRFFFWLSIVFAFTVTIILFYILLLHNLLFPNGMETGWTLFDDFMDWLFEFVNAEAEKENAHESLEGVLRKKGRFTGLMRPVEVSRPGSEKDANAQPPRC